MLQSKDKILCEKAYGTKGTALLEALDSAVFIYDGMKVFNPA